MAASSIEYDFVVNDRQNAERLIRALTKDPKPVKELSGKEAIEVLIKWKNEK